MGWRVCIDDDDDDDDDDGRGERVTDRYGGLPRGRGPDRPGS
jgi:hypothetical protein